MPMNPFLSKLMTYHEVHQLSRNGFSISYISKHLGLNWRTVRKLLAVEDDRDYEKYLENYRCKNKILQPYETFVRSKLEQYPDTSSAQMHDWLKEHFMDFPVVAPKTVFNFIAWIRGKYHIPKIELHRVFEMVEETPYGAQGQIDFGQYNMRNNLGKRIKVYFFALVLSRSRYKYVSFSIKPFTSHLAIEAHESAFKFIEGITGTLIYDQDKVFLTDENKGDLILTQAFRDYAASRGFKLHFCRKSDPQSKGKIENVIRYIKQNFLYNRPFTDIDILNAEALAWLARTANHLPHAFTRKAPAAEWLLEKPYLQPFHPVVLLHPAMENYGVRKDNSFSYKGNLYSLPAGTYSGRGSTVLIQRLDNLLSVYNLQHQLISTHKIPIGKGEKVINNDHKREKGTAISELEDKFCTMVGETQMGRQLIAAIRRDKPRYIRDQLQALLQVIESTATEGVIAQTLQYCCAHGINSASDFKSIAFFYVSQQEQPCSESNHSFHFGLNPLNHQLPNLALIEPATSSINDYDMF